VRIGLALPQYDFSVVGESPLTWETLRGYATRADAAGFDSLWLSDHLFFDVGKYGGSPEPVGAFEPIVTLGALARDVTHARLGTLVVCEALRPATVLAKALASLDRITGGRLDVGLGAGWYEPEYAAIGMDFPSPGERLARLGECVDIVTELLAAEGAPLTYEGRFHRADGARNLPAPLQSPRPPVFVGGKGNRLIRLAVDHADGWNTCWVWTPDAYRERLDALTAACDWAERDPATVWRSLGLYALCGEDEADLARRFERLRASTPAGVLDSTTLEEWRVGRLVGTVEQVREQAATWSGLGVETLILGVGAVPFHVGAADDIDLLAEALGVVRPPTTAD
jgi:alkanesulfonate monooxygenase SsuD/methylene tetrahydromethanopterin reductase-like flavin-dependent oxidoreductase (luciferase family)